MILKPPTWSPGPELLEQARTVLHVRPESAEAVAIAAGQLALLGARPEVARALALDPSLADLARCVLASHDFEALEGAAMEVAARSADLTAEEDAQRFEAAKHIEAGFVCRDQTETILAGAEALLGVMELSAEQESYLSEFEEVVRPELWRLVPMNTQRARGLEWVQPEQRARFWWRFDGNDVPEDALESLARAAHLLARFPEAREQLMRLQAAQELIQEAQERPRASVVPLAEWLARRATSATASSGREPLLAAGFAQGEVTLLHADGYELSWRAPDVLIVDVVDDLTTGSVPELRTGGRGLPMVLVRDCEQRFELVLDSATMAAVDVVLDLPLASGCVEVSLTDQL